jgi:hypothetical protein
MDPETGTVNNQSYVDLEKKVESGKFQPKTELKIFNGAKGKGNAASKNITNIWVERGPYSVGGRVRGIMFDPNDTTGKKYGQVEFPADYGTTMTSLMQILNGHW